MLSVQTMKQIASKVNIVHMIEDTTLNNVGMILGYDWNQVCDEVQDEGLIPCDGEGSSTLYRTDKFKSEIIQHIVTSIFDSLPQDIRKIVMIVS